MERRLLQHHQRQQDLANVNRLGVLVNALIKREFNREQLLPFAE